MRMTRWMAVGAIAALGIGGTATAASADTGGQDGRHGASSARSVSASFSEADLGRFSGTVKTASGAGIRNMPVELVTKNGTYGYGLDETKAKGTFSVTVWAEKSVTGRVAVNRFSGESKYVGGYWAGNGKPVAATYAKGKKLTVAPGQKVTGITPVLGTCATVSGKVTRGDKHTSVLVFNDANKQLVSRADAAIGSDGRYKVRGLAKGRYYVVAVKQDWIGGAGQRFESFYGTKSGKKPAKPNLVISSCKNYTKVNLTSSKIVRATTSPTITGQASPGMQLTAMHGKFSPSKGLTYRYQWSMNGNKVSGATGRTFWVPASAQPSDLVAVTIKASKPGYKTAVTFTGVVLDQ